MRIDLPQCNLKTCRYSCDGNCVERNRFDGCEYAYVLKENTKLKSEIEQWKTKATMNTTPLERTVSKLQEVKIIELKAEIEQLKWKLSSVETQRDLKGYDAKRNADIMSSQLKIIKQLKEELEKSEEQLNFYKSEKCVLDYDIE